MQGRKKNRFDDTWLGFAIGILVPVIVFFIVFMMKEEGVSFSNYIKSLWYLQALVKLGSLCVFANSIVFMGFIRLKFEKTARGILGATLLYAFAVLISRAF